MTLTGDILFCLNDIRELKQLRDESFGMRRNVACADLAVKQRELADLEAALFAGRAILAPIPRRLSAHEMRAATDEARELRARLDRATHGMESWSAGDLGIVLR